jgi:hypothetical protein
MKLSEFMQSIDPSDPLESIEVLPDNRLINVVTEKGELFGCQVSDVAGGLEVRRLPAVFEPNGTILSGDLTFDGTQIDMLTDSPEVAE